MFTKIISEIIRAGWLAGCLMQLVYNTKVTSRNHCPFSLSATKVYN